MPLRRTAVAALIALPMLSLRARAASLRLTPAQTEGPFYPTMLPADQDADLLVNGARALYARGRAAWVEGTLTDADGRALREATIEIWQCDEQGHYRHPRGGGVDEAFQGFGRVATDARGRWRFRTIKPVTYGGRAPHIHVKVKQGTRELLTTQLYVEADAGNARDFVWNSLSIEDRAAVTAPYVATADGLTARYALVVAG